MFVAEVDLTHPELALTRTIESGPPAEMELDYQVIADPETYYLFFEVETDAFDEFEAAVAEDPTVAEHAVIVDGGDSRVYRMRLLAIDHLVLPKAAELGMQVLRAVNSRRGWKATLRVPDSGELHEFRSYCVSKDVDFEVLRLYRAEDGDVDAGSGLTEKQRETLLTAYRAGYFDEPRSASLDDVAESLGVSSSAASGRLRRATRALVAETVADGREERAGEPP